MNVYLYQSGTEKILKNAYIGEVYYYNYTFKGKTTSQILQDFSVVRGTLQVNSDGFTGTSSVDCFLRKDIPSLSTARKITITGTVVVNSTKPNNNAAFFGIATGETSYSSWAINRVEGSVFGGINVSLRLNDTTVEGNSVGNTTQGTYTQKFIIDLENKKMTGSVNGFNDSTLTLTDSQVAGIKGLTYLAPYVSLNYSAISEVSIIIE